MNIDEMTIGEAREIASIFGSNNEVIHREKETFFYPGCAYFIRTVTHHHIGELVRLNRNGHELIFKKAAWIASDGRFADAMKDGIFDEVEPFPDGCEVLINRETIIDTIVWDKAITRSQK